MLWTLVLLALLGASLTAAGRSETTIATNLTAAAAAEAAADAGITATAFHLLDAAPNDWQADGQIRQLRIGDATVTIQALDQRGAIDPNDATAGLLTALLRQLGIPDAQATPLGTAILAWHTTLDPSSPPTTAPGPYAPPHEPFQSLNELTLIPGINPALLARMQPHLSLYLNDTPDPALADPIVQAAVADALKRNALSLDTDAASGPLLARITATARINGASFTRTALLRMTAFAGQNYQVLEWR